MNFYEILEIDPQATAEEIKSSFRRLAKKFHPDVNQDAEAQDRFRLVYMAYDILQDERKRKLYDELQVLKTIYSAPRTGREMDEMRRYQNRAARQADTYAEMDFEEFEESILSKLDFHGTQLLAFLMFFVMLCVGIIGIMVGWHYVFYEDFNGARALGYIFWLFGGAVAYTGLKALYDIFDIWRK